MRGPQTVDWSRAYDLMQRKSNRRIIASTAYTAAFARLLDPLCDLLLVDCDVAVLMHGLPERGAADLDMMLLHGKSASRGAKRSAVVIELPGSAWMQSPEQAFRSASRLLDETGCCGVMLPLETVAIETTRFLLDRGIPVMSGVDISPPADAGLGRQFAEGEKEWLRIQVLKDAAAVGQAGVFAIVATGRNDALALQLSKAVGVPVIGAESASLCDGDLLRDVECLALLNSARRNADLSTRAAPRPGWQSARTPGHAERPAERPAVGAGAIGPRGEPRATVPAASVAAPPQATRAHVVAPASRTGGAPSTVGEPDAPKVRPIRRVQSAAEAEALSRASTLPPESPSREPSPAASLTARRPAQSLAGQSTPGGAAAGSPDRVRAGRILGRAAPAQPSISPDPDRRAPSMASRTTVPAASSVSPPPPSSTAAAPLSNSLQHSLEALFGLDPDRGEPPPRRLRPVDPARDPEADLDAAERGDAAEEAVREPSADVERDIPTSVVVPIPFSVADRAASGRPAPESLPAEGDSAAEVGRRPGWRPALRPLPLRRKPPHKTVAAGVEASAGTEGSAARPVSSGRPRLVRPPAAVAAPVESPGARSVPERRAPPADEHSAGQVDALRRFAVRAAGVVLLIGVMMAGGFGAATYLRGPAGEVRTDATPVKTRSGGKGEFGAGQGLAANVQQRDAFAPRDRPVEVKILQTRPLF